MKTPEFLLDYDVFAILGKWSSSGTGEQGRHWTLRQWKGDFVMCELTWRDGDQCCFITKAAASAPEAVFIAMESHRLPISPVEKFLLEST